MRLVVNVEPLAAGCTHLLNQRLHQPAPDSFPLALRVDDGIEQESMRTSVPARVHEADKRVLAECPNPADTVMLEPAGPRQDMVQPLAERNRMQPGQGNVVHREADAYANRCGHGTVDRLSRGRVVLGAGLGALHPGWTAFEPDEGRRVRAAKLDESLAIYAGLLAGQPFSYDGRYYSAQPTDFNLPDPPVQRPHPPVWVIGAYVSDRDEQPSLDRAARWQGLLPQVVDVHESEAGRLERGSRHVVDPDELERVVAAVRRRRTAAGLAWDGYDVVIEADSSGEFVQLPGGPSDWAAAGGTWWVESWWSVPRGADGLDEVRRRVSAGPPSG